MAVTSFTAASKAPSTAMSGTTTNERDDVNGEIAEWDVSFEICSLSRTTARTV
jgi:hypothetical protein